MVKTDFENLKRQALEFTNEMLDQQIDEAQGDSPIEKILFAALQIRAWLEASEFTEIVRVENEDREQAMLDYLLDANHWSNPDTPVGPAAATTLIIRPQAVIKDRRLDVKASRRVDFLIHALDWRDDKNRKWRRLIVECDGHEYHERTKQQAKRDRSRDRIATMDGYDCFRFTGSEIYNNPWGCAEQITDWAGTGWR